MTAVREPFDPPYTKADLPELDRRHAVAGLSEQWHDSIRRWVIAHPTQPKQPQDHKKKGTP